MKANMFRSPFVAITSLFLIFGANTGLEAKTKDYIEKIFKVDFGGNLNVETDFGSIQVAAVSGKNVRIEVFKELRPGGDEDNLEDFEVSFDQTGDNITVTGEWNGSKWQRGNKLTVKYVIEVPEKYNVDLKTSGGSISVDDLEGEVLAKTSGGSLHFGSIKGPVDGKTSGGSITLAGCIGDADIHTSGGSIKIGEVEGNVEARTSGGSIKIEKAAGNVYAKTSGGSIQVDEVFGVIEASTSGGSVTASLSQQPRERCSLKTSGGSVNVHLSEDVAVNLDASTSSGRVSTDINVSVQGKMNRKHLVGEINGGGPELYLRTSGGNINIKKL